MPSHLSALGRDNFRYECLNNTFKHLLYRLKLGLVGFSFGDFGCVVRFREVANDIVWRVKPGPEDRLLADAIKYGNAMRWKPEPMQAASAEIDQPNDLSSFSIGSTAKRASLFGAGSSGAKRKGVKPRRRP
ncbi:unnamed protein product [Arabis nemorensis]|uniref:Uncharacterized protein n=1 Tax=Arabis nemorensis TaxID=586526 RepID=A0A565C567_9BRAS|nr:unnamed protein product [Arabis nemorensis]